MDEPDDIYGEYAAETRPPDPQEIAARDKIAQFVDERRDQVFFSRQIEVQFEDEFFHWVTNRAIRDLEERGAVLSETRKLIGGNSIKLLWHKSNRYYRREAADVVKLVEAYSDPNISGALGLHGESMVLEGFAIKEFVTKGRNTNEFRGKKWTRTNHNLDFIFERDGRAYGVEVKNMLGYMDQDELKVKIDLCRELGIVPVFVARMLPKVWIEDVRQAGGFCLILKWQLYPHGHKELAMRVQKQLNLPVDSPKALKDGTVQRFLNWHLRQIDNER